MQRSMFDLCLNLRGSAILQRVLPADSYHKNFLIAKMRQFFGDGERIIIVTEKESKGKEEEMDVLTAIYTYKENILTVRLNGEIDHHSAREVRGEIDRQILYYKPREVILDLGQVGFMDSSGLGLIMGRYSKMQVIGGEFVLREPCEGVMRIIRLSGLDKIIKVEKSEKEGRDKR